MERQFNARALELADADRTFPLAATLGFTALAPWRAFLDTFVAKTASVRGGIALVEDSRGYVAGFFCYRADDTAADGHCLVCDPFIAAEWPRYATSVRALVAEAERLAREMACPWIRVALDVAGQPLWVEPSGRVAALFRTGFALYDVVFRKHIAAIELPR